MAKIVFTVGTLACVVVIFGTFWYFTQGTGESTNIENGPSAAEEVPPPVEIPREVPTGFKEYKNGRFGFSLLIPEGFSVQETMESATSYSIVFENPDGAGFQMFMVAYAEPQISEERFNMDVPSGVRKNPQDITIDGVQAVAFESNADGIGETQEIWFIKNGYLFEVTTYKPLTESLATVMGTWKFLR